MIVGVFHPATDVLCRASDAAEFKESEHPRQPDGKFGSGASKPVMPKGMESKIKGDHKTVSSYCHSLLAEGKYSNAQIAQAAQAQFGGKTSPASVAWYKMEAKKKSPEGKKAEAAKQQGIKANDQAIAQAAKTPLPPAKVDAALTTAESKDYKTVYVSAKDSSGKAVYVKLKGVPDGADNSASLQKAMAKQGLSINLVGPFSESKPAPAGGYKELALSFADADEAKQAAFAKQAADTAAKSKTDAEYAAANKTVTKTEEELNPAVQASIKHYTNGSYRALNDQLRKGLPLSDAQATLAANLDLAIKKSHLTEATTLYRKMSNPQAFLGPDPKVGMVLLDNGFISTSKSSGTWSGSVHLTIECKAGAAALDVQKLSLHTGEKEVMLPRGSLFKVLGITGQSVKVEYLG